MDYSLSPLCTLLSLPLSSPFSLPLLLHLFIYSFLCNFLYPFIFPPPLHFSVTIYQLLHLLKPAFSPTPLPFLSFPFLVLFSVYCWRARRLIASSCLIANDFMTDGDIGKVRSELSYNLSSFNPNIILYA